MESSDNVVIEQNKKRFKPIYVVAIILILIVSFMVVFLFARNIYSTNDDPASKFTLGPVYNTAEFTVNLAETNGKRYLKAQLSLEVDHKKVLKELEEKLPVLEDKIILVLSEQKIVDLDSLDGKENIKKQLRSNINEILTKGEIINIYFNHFVWQ